MPSAKILIIDDSHAIRFQLERILIAAGYQVITASDGSHAIELLKQQKPSLLLLDIKMPGLDGYGVCEEISQLHQGADRPPVVFLTSLRTKALELLGKEFGAYLQKPVSEPELLRVVQEQLDFSEIS
jgi:CheY-like chemotaxis protein